MHIVQFALFSLMILLGSAVNAIEMKSLPYPVGQPNADNIAKQVFFVNRLFAFSKLSIEQHPKAVAVVVDSKPGKRKRVSLVERHTNNTYENSDIASRELSIFRTGKLKGTAILLTDYKNPDRSPDYLLRLPLIKTTRRIEITNTQETWGGTVFTFAEMLPNNPSHEKHELLDEKPFESCLSSIEVPRHKYLRDIDVPDQRVCDHKGKQVYRLKSTPEKPIHWYDYRITHVDATSFADYRTEYFKDGNIIKTVDRDWRLASKHDPRALQWHHLYGKDRITGHETYIVVPNATITINSDTDESFWSEKAFNTLEW